MDELRELYRTYYHSYPDEKWMSRRNHRFKAKPLNEMTEIEMMSGEYRSDAEEQLNNYFEEFASGGWQWGSKWFYQDSEMPSLILLKEWFK